MDHDWHTTCTALLASMVIIFSATAVLGWSEAADRRAEAAKYKVFYELWQKEHGVVVDAR